jgi:hypothetical protein
MTNTDIDRAMRYLRVRISNLSHRGDMSSIEELREMKNIEEIIKSLTGRK